MFHEAIYAILRSFGETNSVNTRRIVGYLFSNLNNHVIRENIASNLDKQGGAAPVVVQANIQPVIHSVRYSPDPFVEGGRGTMTVTVLDETGRPAVIFIAGEDHKKDGLAL